MRPFLIAGLLIAINCQIASSAQSKRSTSPGKPEHAREVERPAKKNCFSNTSFSEQGDLPPNFCGVDAEALIEAMEKSPLLASKSEFESTAKYEERLGSFSTTPVVGSLKPTDNFAVVLRQDQENVTSGPFRLKYDADQECFLLTLPFMSQTLYLVSGHPDVKKLNLKTVVEAPEEYEASNAMGAKVTVKKLTSQSFMTATNPRNRLFAGSKPYQGDVALTIYVSSGDAQAVKPMLAVALVGTMSKPWFGRDVFSSKATIDDPYEILDGQSLMFFEPTQLLVFRNDTGKVLLRKSF